MINIVYAFDNNYVLPFSVSAYSLLKSASTPEDVHIYALCNGVTDTANMEKINSICNDFGAKFTKIDTKIDNLDALQTKNTLNHIKVSAYIRLYIADLLPELSRCIYLDCDTLVYGDVKELWDIDLGEYIIGACYEEGMSEYGMKTYGFTEMNCFNSGVLLLDLAKYKQNNILDKLLELHKIHHEKFNFAEQEILNLLFYNKWAILPPEWNEFHVWFDSEHQKIKQANILHFITPEKPWNNMTKKQYENYVMIYNNYINYKRQ